MSTRRESRAEMKLGLSDASARFLFPLLKNLFVKIKNVNADGLMNMFQAGFTELIKQFTK